MESGSKIVFEDSFDIGRLEPVSALKFLILLIFDFRIYSVVSIYIV
jgi:hypothetical protein